MALIKRWTITNAGEGVQKLGHAYVGDGNVKFCSHFGKEFSNDLKIYTQSYSMT